MKIPSPYTPQSRAQRNFYQLGGGELHALKLYLKEMNSSMQNQKALLRKNHRQELRNYPQYGQMIDQVYEGYYYDFDKRFFRILMNSAFVTAFSIFESLFKKVCVFAASKYSMKTNANFTNNIIVECNRYIIRTLHIDLSDRELVDFWDALLQYKTLRNRITHRASMITKDDVQLIKFLRGKKYVKIRKQRNQDSYLVMIADHAFINEFIDVARPYLANILLKLPPKAKGYKIKRSA